MGGSISVGTLLVMVMNIKGRILGGCDRQTGLGYFHTRVVMGKRSTRLKTQL